VYGRCTRHAPALGRPGRTVSQLRVPDKTNEITAFTAVLAPFDLTGTVVTADALHTQRNHAIDGRGRPTGQGCWPAPVGS
jgi:hypothetical protein